jgi:hydrogenase maturation protease
MIDLLVLGCGNELRGDDGVGPRIANTVEEWNMPGVRGIAVAAWAPDLADEIADSAAVLFVDAVGDADRVALSRIQATEEATVLSHCGGPAELLALAVALTGCQPDAWLLAVPASDFDYGIRLTPSAQRGVTEALLQIRTWIADQAIHA